MFSRFSAVQKKQCMTYSEFWVRLFLLLLLFLQKLLKFQIQLIFSCLRILDYANGDSLYSLFLNSKTVVSKGWFKSTQTSICLSDFSSSFLKILVEFSWTPQRYSFILLSSLCTKAMIKDSPELPFWFFFLKSFWCWK